MSLSRRLFVKIPSLALLGAVSPVFASDTSEIKRILVYGDSNSFGWAYSPEKGVNRLPIDKVWPQVMAKELGAKFQVEVNALGGRTICRDQPDGIGTGKSLKGEMFNGTKSLPAVLAEHLPLDLIIVMLGTNDANMHHQTNAQILADDLERLSKQILAGDWQSHTQYKIPRVLLIAPPVQPDETLYGQLFMGSQKITRELPALLEEKAKNLGVDFLNSQDFVKGIPGQIDRVHLAPEQHHALGVGVAGKVKTLMLD